MGVVYEVDPEPEQPVAKYLAANYVKMRESYSYNGLEVQVNKIRNSSTKFVYKQFYNNISLDNPDSPVLLYQRTSSRSVDIKSVNFSTDANNIMVRFDATVSDHKNKNVSTTTRWIANVSFSMSDINRVIKENTEFNFIVTDYHVQQIK
jgi:type IV secretion system protein VirB8